MTTWKDIDDKSLDDQRRVVGKRGNPAAEDDIGNKIEIATSDLHQIARKLRNVAKNIPAAKVCNELADDIRDVLNFLNDEGQTP